MAKQQTARNSETVLMESIHRLSNAGGSVIQIKTREPLRTALSLRKHFITNDSPYTEWDVINGNRVFTKENYIDHKKPGDDKDFMDAFSLPLRQLRDDKSDVYVRHEKTHFYVFVDPHPYIAGNPPCIELIQQYSAMLPATNVCTLFITPDIALADVPVGVVLTTEMPTPTLEELEETIQRIITEASKDDGVFPEGHDLDENDFKMVAQMGLGLTLHEAETYAAISIIEASEAGEQQVTRDRIMDGIAKGKTSVVKQSEILELHHPEDISNVGGMGRLKEWMEARAGCYSEDADAFGIEAPKGMVLAGVPGTGKSLFAKVTSSVMGIPLVRLDFGRVFSKYVGDSESRVRAALSMVESMAPVVLFVDEIDKGLGGASGSGDSGTSARVLGSYLTWLQDCKAPVFNVVTANRVDGLPPELLRRGRFDQIFFVGLPSAEERLEVLYIHLRKRGREMKFTKADVDAFLKASEKFVPAEIESAVKDGMVEAFNDTKAKDIEMRHILTAMESIIPLAKSNAAQIDNIIKWGEANAINVSHPPASAAPMSSTTRVLRPRNS